MFDYIVEIEKFNEHHDPKTGRFTHAPGGGSWSERMSEERARVDAMKPNEQARYVWKNGGETKKKCLAAMKNGKTEALVSNYFKVMEKNGDPTPTKPTSGQMTAKMRKDAEELYGGDYKVARKEYIKKIANMNDEEADKTEAEFREWFGGDWFHADTKTLDRYIEKDHAYKGEIYRGMDFETRSDFDAFMKDVSPGATIGMRRNSSWTSDKETASDFAGIGGSADSVMITCVKNRTSAPVDHLSGMGESEVLAHSKAKWTVLHSEVVEDRGARRAYITVVEKGAGA